MRLFSKILQIGLATEPLPPGGEEVVHLLHEVDARARRLFGRALAIREVDAGSCNGCELEITGLMSPVYDSERFGVHFVASPRHADMLLVTGPVTRNMAVPLVKTYEATPAPNWWWRWGTAPGRAGSSRAATPSRAASTRSSRSTPSWTAARRSRWPSSRAFSPPSAAADERQSIGPKRIGPMMFLFGLMLAGYAFGAAVAVLTPGGGVARRLVAAGAVVGSGAGLGLALEVFTSGAPFGLEVPTLLSIADGLVFRLDALGAFFLGLVGLVGIPCAIYGVAYSEAYEGRCSLRLLGAMLNLFLLTMSLVPCAGNVLTFLLMWEGMSLTSYFLVLTETDEPDTIQAGAWYLAMTHAGLALLLAAFLLLAAGAVTTDFGDLRAAAPALSPAARNAVFLLALLGFGSKAGIIPLHVWLPRAHPAAPSHVSALMSGVMIKLGVYGLLRVGLDLLGGGPAWWGALLIGLGALSAVIGVLYALMENDLKRLLAYSSVENIGLIFIGLGTGFLFWSLKVAPAAFLALAAALYHALNHAAFKGLLFLGAGSVLHATHTRDMNRLGGLIRGLPWTAACFLTGSLAIAGLPPLNGFVSEWLLFQSLLPGIGSPVPLVAPLMTLAVGVLALTGGLAAAAFVKAFGITFLAIPRSPAAEHAHEAPLSMRIGMGILAAVCAGFGLAAILILPALAAALATSARIPAPALPLGSGLSLFMPGGFARMSPILVAVGLALSIGGTWLGVRVLGRRRPLRISETWGCGRVVQTPRMEYTSTAFAEPLRRVFAELYRPTQDLSIDFHPESKYFVQSIEYRSEIVPWFERYLYAPLVTRIRRWGIQTRAIQSGSAHAYLTYLVVALVGLLALLLVRQM